jgi:4-oxalomesaconate hydratase
MPNTTKAANGSRTILVIAAHVGDFVWRAGGTLARCAKLGIEVNLVVLSYGLRGESNGYWKQEGASMQEGKVLRKVEGQKAAHVLGIRNAEFWEYEDYPMFLDKPRLTRLAEKIAQDKPELIITHDSKRDVFNTDHTLIGQKVYDARLMAGRPHTPVWGFEPHVPDLCGFVPGVFIDVSDAMDVKYEAMQVYAKTQKSMFAPYMTKAVLRANQSGIAGCTHAEAFACIEPRVANL